MSDDNSPQNLALVGFNAEYQMLVDGQGLPLPISNVVQLVARGIKHLGYSNLEVEAIARRLVAERAPRMEQQINWAYFTDGAEGTTGLDALRTYMVSHE